MEAYKLKDSGVDCLGKIPEHWVKGKIKNRFFLKPSNVDKKSYDDEIPVELCNYVDVYYNDFITNHLKFMPATATAYEIKKFSLELEDVILTKDSEDPIDIGVPALVKEIKPNLVCGYHLTMLRKRPCHVSGSFLFWALADKAIASQFYREATGVTRWAISSRNIKNVAIAYPNLEEQKAIADYLDKACQNIDKTISLKKQQLEKLEAYRKSVIHEAVTKGLDQTVTMKDSGVDLFGKIPQAWRMHRIKGIVKTKITDGPHETPQLEESGIPFISAEAIKADKINFNKRRGFISQELHDVYSKKCKPQKFDIFIIKSGATTGNVAYVDTDMVFNIWSPLALVRCKETIADYKFIYYQLLGDVFRKQVELAWSFGTQENIGMGVLGRIKISLPPLHEQKEIAKYLDDVCGKINKTKEITKNQIKTLTQYRQSLIHECVTGKKRVYQGAC